MREVWEALRVTGKGVGGDLKANTGWREKQGPKRKQVFGAG